MYYGQNKEDRIIDQIIKKKYGKDFVGNFLELGANDGVTLSNSRFFLENGWTGFLVEPSKNAFERLIHVTEKKHRCFNVALGTSDCKIKFYESKNHLNQGDISLVSSIILNETDRWKKSGVLFEEYEVDCFCWGSFVESNSLESTIFDVISIDIEGMDYEILTQMDLKKLGCKVLCVEFNGKNLEKYFTYVSQFGMSLVHQNNENLIFSL